MQLTSARPARDEGGNIIVALLVIMLTTLLSMTVLARTLSALASVRQNQDFSASLAQADAAMSDALFRIDQFGANDISSFCVGNASKCAPSTVPAAPTASYSAVKVDSNTFTVTALGDVNNRPHAIQATVVRTELYPFAIFGTGDVTFNGNGSGTIEATLPGGVLDPNRFADTGGNATVTCNSGANEGDQQVSYKDSWKGCPTQIAGVGSYVPKDPVVASSCPSPNTNVPPVPCVPSSGVFPCPLLNTFGVLGVIAAGSYLCTGSVTFSSLFPITITGAGAVKIYVIPASGTADVELASTTINDGGDPRNFAVYLAGAGTVDMGNGSHNATITGTVWAPSANITNNGCKMFLTGALVIGTYTCNGGPNLTVNYDSRLQSLVGTNWSVANYTEIPSSQFSLPGF
jgi:hypothetical protein